MPPSVSSQALDAGWSHILHQPIAVRALLTQEASIPPGAVGRSLAYSTEALAWPAYCRVSGKALPFPESRRAFLGATKARFSSRALMFAYLVERQQLFK